MTEQYHLRKHSRWPVFVGLMVGLVFLVVAYAPVHGYFVRHRIEVAALDAQAQCHARIHHEAYDFADCVQAMANQERDPARQLGIAYFGWVGALGSARLGMRGAQETAYTMMDCFLVTQAQLGVSDADLCSLVPGDCAARLAILAQMRVHTQTALRLNAHSRETGSAEQHSD